MENLTVAAPPRPIKPPPPVPIERFLQLPRWLLWIAITAVVGIIALVTLVAVLFIKPAPPRSFMMSTGPIGSDYHKYGLEYQRMLARHGVNIVLEPSAGSPENLIRLGDPQSRTQVAFFQGGTGYAVNSPGLVSLGSLNYEPLWVFYRGAAISDLNGLAGKRIGIGPNESGTHLLALQLLAVNAVVMPPTTLHDVGGAEAAAQLRAGQLDAICLVAPAESELIQQLVSDKDIRLLSIERADAYVRRFPYLTKLVMPKGVLDFAGNAPAADVTLIAPTTSLLARDTLHPALVDLLLRAAKEIHGGAGLLNQAREFPNLTDSDFPYADDVTRFYKSGSPFLQRHLPFWLANLIERLWVLVLPAFAIAIPLIRSIPPLLRWWRRSRIYRWYARLKEIELELDHALEESVLRGMLARLDQIDRAVGRLHTPLAYSENLYNFRTNIAFVRSRVLEKLSFGAQAQHPASAPEQLT